MINPHIVVGPNRMCMCGQYGGKDLTCGQILETLDRLESVRLAIGVLVQECDQPFVQPVAMEDKRMRHTELETALARVSSDIWVAPSKASTSE